MNSGAKAVEGVCHGPEFSYRKEPALSWQQSLRPKSVGAAVFEPFDVSENLASGPGNSPQGVVQLDQVNTGSDRGVAPGKIENSQAHSGRLDPATDIRSAYFGGKPVPCTARGSIAASSSSVRTGPFKAAKVFSSCATLLAPMRADVTCSWRSTQEIAS